jgi:hypothetical protein
MLLAKAKGRARPRSLPATGGSTYYYLTDGGGSVVGLTDSSGNLVDQYSYDPQGNYTSQSGSVPNPFGYGGMTYDSSTGLYSTGDGGGYYDPSVGQYSQGGSCDAYGGGGMCMQFGGYDPFNWVYEEASFATPDNGGYCEIGVLAFKSVRAYRGQQYLHGWADVMCTTPVNSVDVYIYAQNWNALPVFGGLFGWGYYETEGMAAQGYCHFTRPVPWHEYRCPKNSNVDAVWLDVGHGKWRFLAVSCTDWLNGYRTCGVDMSRAYQF